MSEKDLVGYYTSRYSGEEIDRMLAGFSNSNLLDNWYFVGGGSQQGGGQFPINQRGLVSYGGDAGQYCIDRWRIFGVVDLISDSILIKPGALMFQFFEEPLKQYLDGKLLTASIWFPNGTFFFGSAVYHKTSSANIYLYSLPNAFELLIGRDGNFYTQVDPNAAGGINPGAFKLELGPVQTLAHQDASGNWVLNDLPPNFQQELAKCQRYLYVSTPVNNQPYSSTISFQAIASSILHGSFQYPVRMRARPAVAIFGFQLATNMDVNFPATTAFTTSNEDGFIFVGDGGAHFEAGQRYTFQFTADANL